MNRFDQAYTWAQHYDFSTQELAYATILQLKILDEKCQMEPEDQMLFRRVYEGIQSKNPTPYRLAVHDLIAEATDDTLSAKPSHKQTIHDHRVHYESLMDRPTMKAYKAMVRNALEI